MSVIFSNPNGLALTMVVSEPSLLEQVDNYLNRLRHAHSFPCDPLECYFGCLPPAVQTLSKQGIFGETPPPPGRSLNLLLSMQHSDYTRVRNVLHVCVEDAKKYKAAMDGDEGYEKIFWMKIDAHMPTPYESLANPFYLPEDHCYRREILAWMDTAYKIDEDIKWVTEAVGNLQTAGMSTATALAVWPELANFIDTKQRKVRPVQRAFNRALEDVPQADRDKVTYQLAKATMLPDKRYPLDAWVDFSANDGGSAT